MIFPSVFIKWRKTTSQTHSLDEKSYKENMDPRKLGGGGTKTGYNNILPQSICLTVQDDLRQLSLQIDNILFFFWFILDAANSLAMMLSG